MKTGENNVCTKFHNFRAFCGVEKCIKRDEISIDKIRLTTSSYE